MKATCIETSCGRPVRSRGRCIRHYSKWLRTVAPEDRPLPSAEGRFWAKVDRREPDECWPWLGAAFNGYGRFWVDGHIEQAHRYALALNLGRSVDADKYVCHRCDNPPCVNPAHLYEGTDQDNVDDMTGQCRQAWGMRNGRRTLTDQDVLSIRSQATAGASYGGLARMYAVDPSTISRVVAGKRWGLLATGDVP